MTTPSEPSLVQLWLHGGLDLSEQLQKEPPECPAENRPPTGTGRWWSRESTGPCGCTTCWQAFCAWCCRPSCC
jgi:hypothetical protein